MKTHLLLSTAVVALLGASSAFAGSNTVYLNQIDSSQNASITQSGSSNTVGYSWRNFVQQNGGLSGHNALVINQSGNNNWVARDAQGYQSGTSNTANISQAGYGSDVELQQSGTENGNGYIAYNNGEPIIRSSRTPVRIRARRASFKADTATASTSFRVGMATTPP
jgi:hypothetical protein